MHPWPTGQLTAEPDGSRRPGKFVPEISAASLGAVTAAQALEGPAFVVALGNIRAKTMRGWGTSMVRALELAIEALGNLPAADQERVGRQLLSYIEKLQQLRIEIERGVRVLEVEAGVPLDVDEFLLQLNQRHGRA
jgi:hypothetical protein